MESNIGQGATFTFCVKVELLQDTWSTTAPGSNEPNNNSLALDAPGETSYLVDRIGVKKQRIKLKDFCENNDGSVIVSEI